MPQLQKLSRDFPSNCGQQKIKNDQVIMTTGGSLASRNQIQINILELGDLGYRIGNLVLQSICRCRSTQIIVNNMNLPAMFD